MTEIYVTQPGTHRTGVTVVDSADPSDTSGAVDTKGYKECRFDITVSGTDFTSLEVQALFWNILIPACLTRLIVRQSMNLPVTAVS